MEEKTLFPAELGCDLLSLIFYSISDSFSICAAVLSEILSLVERQSYGLGSLSLRSFAIINEKVSSMP